MWETFNEDFKNPPNHFRGKPFWAWNGKLDKEILLRQIHEFKEMGMGGFFMHSRTGLATEYLGEEWFECINACADEAEKIGMEAWLYDEDRWPSGTAGGKITENPEYRLKFISLYIIHKHEFRWNKKSIATFSCDLVDFNYYNLCKIDESTQKCDYSGDTVLSFIIEEQYKQDFYNGNTYVDVMNLDATLAFIKETHEKYKENCGIRFSSAIKGIFTDEPHRGALMGGFGINNENALNMAPYTQKLFQEFQERFGYDLVEKLPELFLYNQGENISKVKLDYTELLMQLFIENFIKPINDWCHSNNIILTGHGLHEDSLCAQTTMTGSLMRIYEHMEYPGIDILGEHNTCYHVAKQLSSVANQTNKKMLLSELYGCTGWQMDFQDYKEVGVWQSLMGINIRCHHLSFYTMEAEAKRDYPASILSQSAWYKDFKYVEDYFSRIHVFLSQGRLKRDTLVINPIESMWSQIRVAWSENLSAQTDIGKQLEENYIKVFQHFMGNNILFDYGDEEMISRLHSFEINEKGKAIINIGSASYEKIFLSGFITIRQTTIDIINKFIALGGEVTIADDYPQYIDGIKEHDLASKMKGCNSEKLVDYGVTNNYITITDKDGNRLNKIYSEVREDGKNKFIMLLNIDRNNIYLNCRVEIKDWGYIQLLEATTANSYSINSIGKDSIIFHMNFYESEDKLILITEDQILHSEYKPITFENSELELENEFSIELLEKNVLVLDMPQYKVDNESYCKKTEILKIDRLLRDRFNLTYRSGEMLQPWFTRDKVVDKKADLTLKYNFGIEYLTSVLLAIETPEKFSITLNGVEIEKNITETKWIDDCFKLIQLPTQLLEVGNNELIIKGIFDDKCYIEAMYLLGDFGVRIDKDVCTIIQIPKKIKLGSITEQGFPFYGGAYNMKVNINSNCRKIINIKSHSAALIKVIGNKREQILAFSPFIADVTDLIDTNNEITIQVVLTRRNTFGPLHQTPLLSWNYGPNNFVTEGDNYSDNYMLYSNGIEEFST